MNLFERLRQAWQADPLLQKVVKNSAYLFSGNTLGGVLTVLQSIFAARLLGVAGFGVLGAVISFASAADRLLSFRLGELVVKYAGQFLAQKEPARAAAVFKTAALTELGTSLLSYLIIVLAAPLAAEFFAKDPAATPYFILYGLSIPAGFIYETSTALLQVGGNFRSQAALNLSQNILTASVIGAAFILNGDIWWVLAAYLLGKTLAGLGFAFLALRRAGELFGPGWWQASFGLLPPRREFWGFAFSSNFSGTVNLVTRDSEVLWVNYFLSPTEGGYYKVALALINLVLMPIDPFIKTSFPEISRAIGEKAWQRLKDLLRRLTTISASVTLAIGLGLAVLGGWFVGLLYGPEYVPAIPAALILLAGYGTANILFWNRPLLLSLGLPTFPLVVSALAGLGKVLLGFALVPRFGYLAQAGLMAGFFVVSIGLNVWRGLGEVRIQSRGSDVK